MNFFDALYIVVLVRCSTAILLRREAYDLRNVVPIQLNVTNALPVQVHIELDALTRSLVDVHV